MAKALAAYWAQHHNFTLASPQINELQGQMNILSYLHNQTFQSKTQDRFQVWCDQIKEIGDKRGIEKGDEDYLFDPDQISCFHHARGG